jgi:hypothetical protein
LPAFGGLLGTGENGGKRQTCCWNLTDSMTLFHTSTRQDFCTASPTSVLIRSDLWLPFALGFAMAHPTR